MQNYASPVQETIDLTSSLISIDTTRGKEKYALLSLEGYGKIHGWDVERIETPDMPDQFNLLFSSGTPEIIFSTHIDTVPSKSGGFVPVVKDGRLYGRGSCDAKGILATMLSTANSLRADGATDFGVLIVSDEEKGGRGAAACSTALKGRGIKYIINGEPTENKIFTAHRGALGLAVNLFGVSCHSGYPEKGVDALRLATKIIDKLFAASESGALGQDEHYGGNATINFNGIKSDGPRNALPGKAEFVALIRTVIDNKKTKELVQTVFSDVFPDDSAYELVFTQDKSPVKNFVAVPGFDTDVAKYCTDIPYFADLAQYVLYGPGSIFQAHTDNEFIEISQIEKAIEDYQKIFKHLKTIL